MLLKGSRNLRLSLTVLFFVLTIINYKLYRDRKREELRYANTSLAQLYFPSELGRISKLYRINENEIKIEYSATSCQRWSLFIDSERFKSDQSEILFLLRKGSHKYSFGCESGGFVDFFLDYFPPEIYVAAGQKTTKGIIQLIKSSIPIGEFEQLPLNEWVPAYSKEEEQEARNILKEVVRESNSTEVKIKEISKFLLNTLDTQRGIPTSKLDKLTPLEQYKAIKSGKGQVWCSNMSAMFVFFANAVGVISRPVGLGGDFNGISLSGHSIAESYFPEFNKWAFVDITSKKVLVKNLKNEPLSVVEFHWALNSENYSSLNVVTYKNGDLVEVNFKEADSADKIYYHRDGILYFPRKHIETNNFFEKLYSYLFRPNFKISMYSTIQDSAHLNAVRIFWIWVGFLIINILCWIVWGYSKFRNP